MSDWRSTKISPFVRLLTNCPDFMQVEFFLAFKQSHPEVQIGQRAFEKLKPYFVRKLRDRYTCCCITHVQMSFLRDALNHSRQVAKGVHGKECACRCDICGADETCTAHTQTYSSLTRLWESVLCPKPIGSELFGLKCLLGNCKSCGPAKKLPICPIEDSDSVQVKVKIFEDIQTGQTETGTKKKRKVLSLKEMSSKELLDLFRGHLSKFIKHNWVYRWQSEQFKECLRIFPDDVVVSVVDFAENYTFKEQNEIQSMHWFSSQVTIFVHITYVRIAGSVHKYYHFYISDDKTHDTLFVQHCFMLHHGWLKEIGVSLKEHWVWSDGAASQFKAKRPFYFVARYGTLTGLKMTWNFSGSGHGKGEHDGAGAVIKRHLTHEQLKPDCIKLQCAADVVPFLRETMSDGAIATYASKVRPVTRVFWEVKVGDVDRSNRWDCKAVEGARGLHCVSGYSLRDGNAFRCRQFSCFCTACLQGHWRRCSNNAHVTKWEYVTLQPSEDANPDDEIEDFAYEGHHDDLSDALLIGDNFAVIAPPDNKELADFFVLKCTAKKQWSEVLIKDAWGNVCLPGSFIVKGLWYQQAKENPYEFKLLRTKPEATLQSHLVRAIKFTMEKGRPGSRFLMSPEAYEAIYNSTPYDV